MKKIFITSVLSFATCTAFASEGWYAGVSVDQKTKPTADSSTGEYHNVFGVTLGYKLSDGYSVEGLIENEQVENATTHTDSGKHEGLLQIRANKDFDTGTQFTPYIGVALGEKNKTNVDFFFYRYDLGLKIKLTDTIGTRIGYRHREGFDKEAVDGTQTKYGTDEWTVAVSYKLTPKDTVSIAYKQERKTDGVASNYNTTGISYAKAF
jgi:opacity protein-like surface antigen